LTVAPGPIDVVGNASVGVVGILDEDLGKAAMEALKIDRRLPRAHAETYSWDAATRQFLNNLRYIPPCVFARAVDDWSSRRFVVETELTPYLPPSLRACLESTDGEGLLAQTTTGEAQLQLQLRDAESWRAALTLGEAPTNWTAPGSGECPVMSGASLLLSGAGARAGAGASVTVSMGAMAVPGEHQAAVPQSQSAATAFMLTLPPLYMYMRETGLVFFAMIFMFLLLSTLRVRPDEANKGSLHAHAKGGAPPAFGEAGPRHQRRRR
jgi:hypothetical protein